MRIEEYKSYMERVRTTEEMDERVLQNLRESIVNEGKSQSKFSHRIMMHTGKLIYRVSIAAVCLIVILLIGRSYIGTGLPSGNAGTETGSKNEETETKTDPLKKKVPTFTNLYGKEIGKQAIKCDYVDENTHIRFRILEAVSDGCLTEIIGYYEAKDAYGKQWIDNHYYGKDLGELHIYGFSLSMKPVYKDDNSRDYGSLGYSNNETDMLDALKEYNTSTRKYFNTYCVSSCPYTGTNQVAIHYSYYGASYNTGMIDIPKQIETKVYHLPAEKRPDKNYQVQRVTFSPLGTILIEGKDFGINPSRLRKSDNIQSLRLALEWKPAEPVEEEGNLMLQEAGPAEYSIDLLKLENTDSTWRASNPYSKAQQKLAGGAQCSLASLRLTEHQLDLESIKGITIDGVYYKLNQK